MCFIVGFLVVVLSTMAFIWLNYVRGQTQMSNNWRKCEITVYVAISPSEQEGRKSATLENCKVNWAREINSANLKKQTYTN